MDETKVEETVVHTVTAADDVTRCFYRIAISPLILDAGTRFLDLSYYFFTNTIKTRVPEFYYVRSFYLRSRSRKGFFPLL